jgi:hypothetical protein
LITPVYVLENPPAKSPYADAKIQRRGRLDEKPQNRNIAVTLPIVLRRITDVTWKRSIRRPTMIALRTEDVLIREISTVPVEGLRPRERAKRGR